jgi:small-conductance mechanosensitive channel
VKQILDALSYIPDWVAGVGILIIGTGLALAVYVIASKTILAVTQSQGSFVRTVFLRIRRLLCIALILIASSLAIQLPLFSDQFASVVSRLISTCVIGLLGWAAMIAVDVASTFYLQRFSVQTTDDLQARKHSTQIRVLRRIINVLILVISLGAALMSFGPVRQFGISLFASAGAAGLVVGLAARPVLSNLIAGIQLAMTQPIRIKDAVIVEGEWGWVDEITSTYVVVKLWDWRRLIVPLSYFMEKPFQNWTRESGEIIGTVYLTVDYRVPVQQMRSKLEQIVRGSSLWNRKVVNLQVTDFKDAAVELRMLVSANTSPQAWDLRCEVREKILQYLQEEYQEALPLQRIRIDEEVGRYSYAEGLADPVNEMRGKPRKIEASRHA